MAWRIERVIYQAALAEENRGGTYDVIVSEETTSSSGKKTRIFDGPFPPDYVEKTYGLTLAEIGFAIMANAKDVEAKALTQVESLSTKVQELTASEAKALDRAAAAEQQKAELAASADAFQAVTGLSVADAAKQLSAKASKTNA